MRCNVVWHAVTRYTATIIRGRTSKVENFASTNSSSWNQNGMKELFHNASHEQGVSLFHVQLLLLVISLLFLYGEPSLHNLWFIHFEIFRSGAHVLWYIIFLFKAKQSFSLILFIIFLWFFPFCLSLQFTAVLFLLVWKTVMYRTPHFLLIQVQTANMVQHVPD